MIYVLDEPSIGLHARDNVKLLNALQALRDKGNTVVVVEHDEETIRAADWIIDFGPGPGKRGGEVVACGTPDDIAAAEPQHHRCVSFWARRDCCAGYPPPANPK